MTSRAAALLRRGGEPRATLLELFFDLVFVFALVSLSHRLLKSLTWHGVLQTLLLLLALWMVWIHTSGLTDRLDSDRRTTQLLVIGTMFGTLLMAAALPQAFGEQGLLFAVAYVATGVGRGGVLVLLLRGDPAATAFTRTLFWSGVPALPWIAGALVSGTARELLWVVAVGLEAIPLALGQPTPRLGRAYMRKSEYEISGAHQAERYRQIFIVALGEPILITGMALSGSSFGYGQVLAAVVAFAGTALLWRIYIHKAGVLLGEAIAAAADSVRALIWSLYAHLTMIAGIVAIAVGDELVVAHPFGHTEPAWMLVMFGGPALFLVGRTIFEYGVFGRVSRSRLAGVLVLAAVAPAGIVLPPLAVAIAPVLVLAAIAWLDAARVRGRPPEPPAPPH